MGVSLLEHLRNEEILEEAKVEAIATVNLWDGEGWNGLDTSKGEVKLKTSEQLQKWRWRGSALEEDQSCDGKILSEGTWKPGKSRRNGPMTEKNGKVSARPATPNRETAAKGEKSERHRDTQSLM